MELPLELRLMIYKCHFLQDGTFPKWQQNCPARDMCSAKTYNLNVPVRMLWTVSKQVYHEAMPIYFQSKQFCFDQPSKVVDFVQTIGPYHRPHITRITLHMHCLDDYSYVFKKFSQYVSLQHLSLILLPYREEHWPRINCSNGTKDLLKIRNLKSVSVEVGPLADEIGEWVDQEEFLNAIQILKHPYDAAAIKRRAARGVLDAKIARKWFTKPGSREDRCGRRADIKDEIAG